MRYTIYKTTNIINGKIYIGKHITKNPNDSYLGSGKILKNAIRKYGKNNFKKEILFDFDTEIEMNEKEAEIVTEDFCIRKDTYNLCEGGRGGFGYINQNNLHSIDGMIASSKSTDGRIRSSNLMTKLHAREDFEDIVKKRTQTFYEKYGVEGFATFKGKKHSDETIRIMKELKVGHGIGKENSQFGTCWITDGKINKKIKKSILEDYLNIGYIRGRSMRK